MVSIIYKMKLINRNTDYAIRALSYIARNRKDMVSVSKISRKLKIPYSFLRKILQTLHKKGLLKSCDGRGGGFTLSLPAEKIFVVDLIKIFQGSFGLTDCIFKKKICPDAKYCILKKKIKHIEKAVLDELTSITIASLHYRR